jgi:hypothetical protein
MKHYFPKLVICKKEKQNKFFFICIFLFYIAYGYILDLKKNLVYGDHINKYKRERKKRGMGKMMYFIQERTLE